MVFARQAVDPRRAARSGPGAVVRHGRNPVEARGPPSGSRGSRIAEPVYAAAARAAGPGTTAGRSPVDRRHAARRLSGTQSTARVLPHIPFTSSPDLPSPSRGETIVGGYHVRWEQDEESARGRREQGKAARAESGFGRMNAIKAAQRCWEGVPYLRKEIARSLSVKTGILWATPSRFYVVSTSRCNAQCIFCPQVASRSQCSAELSHEAMMSIVRVRKELSPSGFNVSVSGGEPLVHAPVNEAGPNRNGPAVKQTTDPKSVNEALCRDAATMPTLCTWNWPPARRCRSSSCGRTGHAAGRGARRCARRSSRAGPGAGSRAGARCGFRRRTPTRC
jgi:hypothetical protein